MGVWDVYHEVMSASGVSKREMWVNHSRESIARRLLDSPANKLVQINGNEQIISVAHTEEMTTKRICAMPGESLVHGGLVDFSNGKWLITEVDPDNEVYERGLMTQCNHILRWIGESGELKEKWCIIEDGTKYLTGEKRTQDFAIGDARIALTIAKDEDTIELSRGDRFLIDDDDVDVPTAYKISKPNRLFSNYNGVGVFRFILTESPLTDADHIKLRIADYSNWQPQKELDSDHKDSTRDLDDVVKDAYERDAIPQRPDKEVWL